MNFAIWGGIYVTFDGHILKLLCIQLKIILVLETRAIDDMYSCMLWLNNEDIVLVHAECVYSML